MATGPAVHSLVTFSECKSALSLDDRDDSFTLFLSIAATYCAENHCLRRIFRRRHTEYFDSVGDNAFFLREYPVREIVSVHEDRHHRFPETSRIDPEHYYCTPDLVDVENFITTLTLTPPYGIPRGRKSIKVIYTAGYSVEEVPPDVKQAVIEIVAWNQTRYRSRRIGAIGTIRGSGREAEGLELTIPENALLLLEPYRRRTI
jgi:hypothetical protein